MYLVAFLQLLPCFTENEDGEQTVHLILPSIFHQRQLDREARTPSDLTTLLTSSILLPCFLIKEDGFSNNLHQGNLLESKNIEERGYPSFPVKIGCSLLTSSLWPLPCFPRICHPPSPAPAPEILQPEAALVSGNGRQKLCSARPAPSSHTSSLGRWILSGSAL